jgi:hypothetical protein
MSCLFEARRADTGEPWSEHKRKLSGFDLVFSPHESVSLASEFAATPAETRRSGTPSIAPDGSDPGAVGWISFRHHIARPTLPIQDGPAARPTYSARRSPATRTCMSIFSGEPRRHRRGANWSLDSRALTDARVKTSAPTSRPCWPTSPG